MESILHTASVLLLQGVWKSGDYGDPNPAPEGVSGDGIGMLLFVAIIFVMGWFMARVLSD